jgi:hypothetical protein
LWGLFSLLQRVTGVTCLDLLEAFCFPQLEETEIADIVFRHEVLRLISATLWGRFKRQIPRRTDPLATSYSYLTPLDFFM